MKLSHALIQISILLNHLWEFSEHIIISVVPMNPLQIPFLCDSMNLKISYCNTNVLSFQKVIDIWNTIWRFTFGGGRSSACLQRTKKRFWKYDFNCRNLLSAKPSAMGYERAVQLLCKHWTGRRNYLYLNTKHIVHICHSVCWLLLFTNFHISFIPSTSWSPSCKCIVTKLVWYVYWGNFYKPAAYMPGWKTVEFDFSFIHSTAYWTDDTKIKLASSQFCQNLFKSFRDGAYSPMNGIWPPPPHAKLCSAEGCLCTGKAAMWMKVNVISPHTIYTHITYIECSL
jgi:hypothetical protein